MHLHFEQNNSAKCDCTILSLSWMGKVPDELPEDEGWKLNRTNYYQEGWLATGNVRGIVGVTFTSSHCRKNAELPTRTNYNLRGHRSDVILVKWNEPYQKLASCDSSGVIFVWIKYEGRWSIELINDRNTPVTHFSWSHDGRMALICYQDGFVLVGSVAGQRYWSSMLNLEATITCGIWTPDDQQVYFGTTAGQIIVMDVHGAMVSQVQLSPDIGITSMAWSCEKFKMEEGEDTEPGVTNAAERNFVLAVSFQNGQIYMLKNYDDLSPTIINTGFDGRHMAIEWSNSRELLAVAGSMLEKEPGDVGYYNNIVKFYSDAGILLYTSVIPNNQMPVTAMTWGHNDRRVFVATGTGVQVARAWRRVGSLQLLARLSVRAALRKQAHLAQLPLPPRLAALVASLFTHTISCCVPEATAVRDFVSRAVRVGRLHCTMLRKSGENNGNQGTNANNGTGVSYTLYLEHLGGLVPLLRGRRISKIRPEFVIFDPQYEGADSEDIHSFRPKSSDVTSSSSGNSSMNSNASYTGHQINNNISSNVGISDSSDSERDEGCSGSPRLQRRKKGRHRSTRNQTQNNEKEANEQNEETMYSDYLSEIRNVQEVPLVEVTSNIWGTKFKIHGLAKNIPANLGQVTYKTSLLHLQPRQMTLVITELRDNLPTGPDPNFNPNIFSEDEEDVFNNAGEPSALIHKFKTISTQDATSTLGITPRNNLINRGRSTMVQNNQNENNSPNGVMIPALARAESYEDEFPYIDLAEMVSFCESMRINGTNVQTSSRSQSRDQTNLIASTYNRGALRENIDILPLMNTQQYGGNGSSRSHSSSIGSNTAYNSGSSLGRSGSTSSSQRSTSSHCPGRHAISPLCCEGSVPTLQSPKNAVAPSDIIFERPPAQTLMSYHASASDYTQNIQQVKTNIAAVDTHNHQPLNLSLSLDHRQIMIKKLESQLETTSNKIINRGETILTQASVHSPRSSNFIFGESHASLFKHCTVRKDRLNSHETKREELKFIDEEVGGNFSPESPNEGFHHRASTVMPITPVGVPIVTAPIADTMIRSCSVGFLDVVNSQLVPGEVTLAMLRKEAPKRLVLVNKKVKTTCCKRNSKKTGNVGLHLKLDSKNNPSTPLLKTCGKSKSLDSSDMLSMSRNLNEISKLPINVEEVKSATKENEYETIKIVKEKQQNENQNIPSMSISRKEITKLSFFTSTKSASTSSRQYKRDLPVCDVCKCVTVSSNTNINELGKGDESYICSACQQSSACNTPVKKSRGLFREKFSPNSDRSRCSSPKLSERNNHSEIEIEQSVTSNLSDAKNLTTLSNVAMATLEQLLYRVRDRGQSASTSTPPSSPIPRPRLPRSSPSSPAPSKKNKRTASASPIRRHLLNSPLLNRRRNKSKNQESSDDELGTCSGDDVVNGKNYKDLETFQKAQLRQKLKRGKVESVSTGNNWSQQGYCQQLRREFVMHNKAPMWNESSQVYQLDFGGRVTQESAKNFQIEFRGKQVMQFGRIDGNAYTLDFQYPFSAIQAFAVALANVTQRLK